MSTNQTEAGRAEFYKQAAVNQNSTIHDVLAKALGYPEYQPGEPGYCAERTNYITGDHTAESLASEAAQRIGELESQSTD